MHSPLNAAFEAASKLPAEQQELFAAFLIAELRDEEEWQTAFKQSEQSLANMAKEAKAEYDGGNCKPLEDLLS